MEKSTIYLLLYIACCAGVIVASIIAHINSPKWQAKLQIWGSVMHTIGILILLASINSHSYGDSMLSIIGLVFIGFLLYIIGLLCYCLKTYTINKANEQLEYLNYQLNDQIEIRNAAKDQSPPAARTPQP